MRAAIGGMLLVMTSMTLGAACSSSTPYSGLPYKPETPVTGANISAAYTIVTDRLRVEIDTGGHRLERAQIVKPDSSVLEAQTIEYSAPSGAAGSPVSIGIGIGRYGGMGGVSTGVGVSTGGVVGGSGSSAGANTIASFPLDQAGPRPWRVRVKLEGMEAVDIVVGSP
jgi:hypothetical protein